MHLKVMNDATQKGETRRYRGFFHCFREVVRNDSPFALYRGMLLSFVGVVVYRGLYFGLYDSGRQLVPKNNILGMFFFA